MIIVLIGVSGSGKSAIGVLLAERLGWQFLDADDFHSPQNIARMASGSALSDADRQPWLDRLRQELQQRIERRESVVLACSALKQRYRQRLDPDPANIHFVHLQGDYELIRARLRQRDGHFMPASLLRSQFAELEPCSNGLTVSIDQPPAAIGEQIVTSLGLKRSYRSRVLADGLMFPEAPRWHEGELWFTDQHARRVMRMRPDGTAMDGGNAGSAGSSEQWTAMDGGNAGSVWNGEQWTAMDGGNAGSVWNGEQWTLTEVVQTPDLPGGLGWLPDGTPLVVLMTERRVCRIENGRLGDYADLSALASFHCNDMLLDDQGHAWVGNFGYDLHAGAPVKPAEIILIPPAGSPRVAARNLIFPNGMAITADGKTLVVAETFAARITAFDLAVDGQLTNPRTWADLAGAFPDGLCLAPDGTLWVAAPNIDQVLHLGEGGEILGRVFTQGRPYACMLGDGQLYITSAETDDPEAAAIKRSGRIEMVVI